MVQPQDYHYIDWDATEINILYCGSESSFHLRMCWGCISFKTKLYCVIYIHYKVRFLLLMCNFPGIILCYIHTLQSQFPFKHVLGLGNLQYKIVLCYTLYVTLCYTLYVTLCYTLYVTLSVSSWQYLSQYWQALYSMSVRSYWNFIMMMQKRQFNEMPMNIFWGNRIINWKSKN